MCAGVSMNVLCEKGMFACRLSVVSPSSLFTSLQCRSNVLHWNKLPLSFIPDPELPDLSSSPPCVLQLIFLCQLYVYAKFPAELAQEQFGQKSSLMNIKLPFFVSCLNIVSSNIYWDISILRLSLSGLFPYEHCNYTDVTETGCYHRVRSTTISHLTTLHISPLRLAVGRAYLQHFGSFCACKHG